MSETTTTNHRSVAAAAPTPGMHRFTVGSAAEAVAIIRERLGPTARVVSVINPSRGLLRRTFGAPKFEVVAELPEPESGVVLPTPERGPAGEPGLSSVVRKPMGGGVSPVDLLRRAGFPERWLRRLAAVVPAGDGSPEATARAWSAVRAHLRERAVGSGAALPSRLGFMGMAGVGRTTALCQWMARETLAEQRTGTVWKVEFDQPNPAPRLEVLAEALGVAVEHYLPGLSEARGDALWVDLPPLPAPGTAAWREYEEFLEAENIGGRVLVLNALYGADGLRESYRRGRGLGATHVVFSHLDEAARCGHLWEFVGDEGLAPLFVGRGPGVLGDLTTDVVEYLIRRTLPGGEGGLA